MWNKHVRMDERERERERERNLVKHWLQQGRMWNKHVRVDKRDREREKYNETWVIPGDDVK